MANDTNIKEESTKASNMERGRRIYKQHRESGYRLPLTKAASEKRGMFRTVITKKKKQ